MEIGNKTVAVLCCLPLFIFSSLDARAKEDNWLLLENSHFTVLSNGKEKDARERLMELEKFRAVIINLISISVPEDATKTEVILFKTLKQFREHAWSRNINGYVLRDSENAVIIQPVKTGNLDTKNVIQHEFVHALLRYHTFSFPRWYEEGLAELLGAILIKNDRYEFGVPPKKRLKYWSMNPDIMSFNKIISDEYDIHKRRLSGDPYIQYWMLTHYLLMGSQKRKKDLDFYLLLYNDGMSATDAFNTAFKQSPDDFWKNELRPYIFGKIPYMKGKLMTEMIDSNIKVEKADMEEVNKRLSEIKDFINTN